MGLALKYFQTKIKIVYGSNLSFFRTGIHEEIDLYTGIQIKLMLHCPLHVGKCFITCNMDDFSFFLLLSYELWYFKDNSYIWRRNLKKKKTVFELNNRFVNH